MFQELTETKLRLNLVEDELNELKIKVNVNNEIKFNTISKRTSENDKKMKCEERKKFLKVLYMEITKKYFVFS